MHALLGISHMKLLWIKHVQIGQLGFFLIPNIHSQKQVLDFIFHKENKGFFHYQWLQLHKLCKPTCKIEKLTIVFHNILCLPMLCIVLYLKSNSSCKSSKYFTSCSVIYCSNWDMYRYITRCNIYLWNSREVTIIFLWKICPSLNDIYFLKCLPDSLCGTIPQVCDLFYLMLITYPTPVP